MSDLSTEYDLDQLREAFDADPVAVLNAVAQNAAANAMVGSAESLTPTGSSWILKI